MKRFRARWLLGAAAVTLVLGLSSCGEEEMALTLLSRTSRSTSVKARPAAVR
jgi:hypothetical protein